MRRTDRSFSPSGGQKASAWAVGEVGGRGRRDTEWVASDSVAPGAPSHQSNVVPVGCVDTLTVFWPRCVSTCIPVGGGVGVWYRGTLSANDRDKIGRPSTILKYSISCYRSSRCLYSVKCSSFRSQRRRVPPVLLLNFSSWKISFRYPVFYCATRGSPKRDRGRAILGVPRPLTVRRRDACGPTP